MKPNQPRTLREVMTSHVLTLALATPASDALAQMRDANVRHAVVVSGTKVVGVVSRTDLGRADDGSARKGRAVCDIVARRRPVVATRETTISDAARLLLKHHIGCLPVVDGGRLVGIVTRADLLRVLARARRDRDVYDAGDIVHPPRIASPTRDKWP